MPPPTTPCPSCGRAFFPASLTIHLPQCQAKMAKMVVPCPACKLEVRPGELNVHLMQSCKVARKHFGGNGGSSSHRSHRTSAGPIEFQRPQTDRSPSSAGLMRSGSPSSRRAKTDRDRRTESPREPLPLQEPGPDGRVQCTCCDRKFAADRIAKHQFICATLARGPAAPPAEVSSRTRSMAIAMGSVRTTPRKRTSSARGFNDEARRAGPMRTPPPSRWRAQSLELQEAMSAVRAGDQRTQKSGERAGRRAHVPVSARTPSPSSTRAATVMATAAARPASARSMTLAQRRHAAECRAAEEAAVSSPLRSHRSMSRVHACNGALVGGGAHACATDRGYGFGGARGGGGFDPASNQTSRDNPLYRGW